MGGEVDKDDGARSARRRRRKGHRGRAFGVVAVLVLAAGAAVLLWRAGGPDSAELQARARRQFDAGEYAAAIIDLKNLLAADRDDGAARLLLGQVYLKAGQVEGAIKELRKARELGLRAGELDQALVRALILGGRFDDAATELALHGDTATNEWLVLQGMLDLGQQRVADARTAFVDVLARDPAFSEARRGLVQAELAANRPDLARTELGKLLDATGDDASLWILRGELDLHEGDITAAREAYTRALALAAQNPMARLGMARVHLADGETDQATNQLDAIGQAGEADPRVAFVRAQVAEARKDPQSALVHLRKVLQLAPMHRESLVAAARLHFALGEFRAAEDYVQRLLELEPANESARRMLGAIQLASGRLDGLGALPAAADAGVGDDPGMLALLGTAYLKHGQYADGTRSLERAAELAPDSLPIRTQLALGKLSSGEVAAGIADLEAIRAEDPAFVQADIMLALAHLQQGHPEEARAVTRALRDKQPDSALARNVDGYVAEVGGDVAAARAAYEAALEVDQDFHPARINLARLAVRAGDKAGAKASFDAVIAREPHQPFALLGLAALALTDNQPAEAERLWQLAREHNPEAVAPRLLLARHFRVGNKLPLAETAIEEAYRLAPFAPQVQAEYAQVKLLAGKYQDALAAAKALTERLPDDLPALDLVARIYNQLGDEAGLTATLEHIAEVAPDAATARVLLARLALRRKDYTAATAVADELKAKPESYAAGAELAGDIAVARDDREAARAAYAEAHERRPSAATVLKLDQAERALGQGSERLQQWLEVHPDDQEVRLVLAARLQSEGAGAAAIPEYERMLAQNDANPIALNNLAWLYHEKGDARALELARRAHERAPQSPEIMDTYGWILSGNGQHEQGLDLLRKAAAAAPDNADIAYHIAAAMAAAGQQREARAALETLLERHGSFELRGEAEALRAELGD